MYLKLHFEKIKTTTNLLLTLNLPTLKFPNKENKFKNYIKVYKINIRFETYTNTFDEYL